MEPVFHSQDSFMAVNGNVSTIKSREDVIREKQRPNSIFERRSRMLQQKFKLLSASYNLPSRGEPMQEEEKKKKKKNGGNPAKHAELEAKEKPKKTMSIQKQKFFHMINGKEDDRPTVNTSSSSRSGTASCDSSLTMRSSGRSEIKHSVPASSSKVPSKPAAKTGFDYRPEASIKTAHQNTMHQAFLDSLPSSATDMAEHKQFQRVGIQTKSLIASSKEVPQEHWLEESLSSLSIFSHESSSEASSYSWSESWIEQEHSQRSSGIRQRSCGIRQQSQGHAQQGSVMAYVRQARKEETKVNQVCKQCYAANKVQINVRKTERADLGTTNTLTSLSGPLRHQLDFMSSDLKRTGRQGTPPSPKKSSIRRTAPNLVHGAGDADVLLNRSVSDLNWHDWVPTTPPSMPNVGFNFIDYVEDEPTQPPTAVCKFSPSAEAPPPPNRRHERHGGSYSGEMSWLGMARSDSDAFYSPCKVNDCEWSGKPHTTQAKLRSTIRNLEAAFIASETGTRAKPSSQSHRDETNSSGQSSESVDKGSFLSPLDSFRKHGVILNPSHRQLLHLDMPESLRSKVYVDRSYCDSCSIGRPIDKPVVSGMMRQKYSGMEMPCQHVQSTSRSMHSSECMLQGYLRCIVKDGFPCYTLTMNDSDDVLLANAYASEKNDPRKDGCRWIYAFHMDSSSSRGKVANVWRNWIKKDDKHLTSLLSGEMEVTSKIHSEISHLGEKVHSIISEFVLFDGKRDHDAAHSQSSRFLSYADTRMESNFSRSILTHSQEHISKEIPWSSSNTKVNSKDIDLNQPRPHATGKKDSTGHKRSFSFDMHRDMDLTVPEVNHLGPCKAPSELAAVVIQTPIDDDRHPKHFIFSSTDDMWNDDSCPRNRNSHPDSMDCLQNNKAYRNLEYNVQQQLKAMPSPWQNISRKDCQQGINIGHRSEPKHPNRLGSGVPKASQCITVMLPLERHGQPNDGKKGPTSLIDRWKSGGKCDCGGWDLGCGMRVLCSKGSYQKSATLNKNISAEKMPLNIYSQGRSQELVLSMIFVQDGFFFLKFHPQLSPLKAFAISLASLHNKSIYIKRNEMLYGRSFRYT